MQHFTISSDMPCVGKDRNSALTRSLRALVQKIQSGEMPNLEKEEERKRKREQVHENLKANLKLKSLEVEIQRHEKEIADMMQELGGRSGSLLLQHLTNPPLVKFVEQHGEMGDDFSIEVYGTLSDETKAAFSAAGFAIKYFDTRFGYSRVNEPAKEGNAAASGYGAASPFILIARCHVKPDQLDAYLAAAEAADAGVKATEPGMLHHTFDQDPTDPLAFVWSEVYADDASLLQHLTNPPLVKFVEQHGEMGDDFSIEVYGTLADETKAAFSAAGFPIKYFDTRFGYSRVNEPAAVREEARRQANIARVQHLVGEFMGGRPEGYMAGVDDAITGSVLGGLIPGGEAVANKAEFGALMGKMEEFMEVKRFEPSNWRAVADDVLFNVDWTFVWKETGETVDTTALVRKVVRNGKICEKYHMICPQLIERLTGKAPPHSAAPVERVQALLAEYTAGRPEGYMAGVADDFTFDVLGGLIPGAVGTDKAAFGALMGSMGEYMDVQKFEPYNFRAMPNSDMIFNVDWTFVWKQTGATVETTAICRKVLKEVGGALMLCEKYHMVDAACIEPKPAVPADA